MEMIAMFSRLRTAVKAIRAVDMWPLLNGQSGSGRMMVITI
jgi:hypothetical protein